MDLKNILIFGDSYSTFTGVVPEGFHVYYTGKRESPPDLNDATQLWWHLLMTETGSKVIQNNSFSGSTICYLGYNNTDCSNTPSFIARLNALSDKGYFKEQQVDTVFVFGGTNDSWANDPIGEVKYSDFEKQDLYSVLPAVCFFLQRLKEELPLARVVVIINTGLKPEIIDGMKHASEHYGVEYVELRDIEKINGHPTINGMCQIKDQILERLTQKQ